MSSSVPPTYTPQTSFSDRALQPITTAGLPGAELDAEFVRVGESVNAVRARLAELQRDDGKMRAGVVPLSALADDALRMILLNGANIRTWEPGGTFKPGDLIADPVQRGAMVEITGLAALASGWYRQTNLESDGRAMYEGGADLAAGTVRFQSGTQWRILINEGEDGYFGSDSTDAMEPFGLAYTPQGGASGTATVTEDNRITGGTYLCLTEHTSTGNFDTELHHWALIAAPRDVASLVIDTFITDGVQTTFPLSVDPVSKANTQVFANGEYVAKINYSLSQSTLIFGSVYVPGIMLEVISGVPSQETILTVTDGSVTTIKLGDRVVTGIKIALEALGDEHFANNVLSGLKIADASIPGGKLANFAVSSQQLGPLSVTAGKIAFYAVGANNLAPNSVTADKIPNGTITGQKLVAGPLTLNGAPTDAAHAVNKQYADDQATETVAAATEAAAAAVAGKVDKAGSTMTGPLVMGTAPLAVPDGAAPLYGVRAFGRITPYFGSGVTSGYKTGTYSRNGSGLLTVTLTAHGLRTNDKVYLDFTTGTGTNGLLAVTKLTDNTFTVPQAGAATSGAVTARLFRIASAKNISSVTTSDGTPDHLVCNFTVPLPSADYAIFGTHGFVASNAGYVMEDTNAGTQLNTAAQGYIFTVGNANPRLVSVAFIG